MDLSTVFSKTPKGLRARASLIGGLSSHLMKVLTHVDGTSKADAILLKFGNLTLKQLCADLIRLEQDGFIRQATVNANSDDGWALTTNFTPMVVEEYQNEEELEALAKAKNDAQARLDAEKKLIDLEAQRLATAINANKKAQKLRDKEKTKAEVKVKAQLEQERIAEENTKLAQEKLAQEKLDQEKLAQDKLDQDKLDQEKLAEKRLKAQQQEQLIQQQEQLQAEKIANQQLADRAAKLAEETRHKAELKAREAAEQAHEQAEAVAKESARREIERISREDEDAQNKAKADAEAQIVAEQIRLKDKANASALQAKIKAAAEAELQAVEAREQALAAEKTKAAAEKALQAEKDKAHVDIANVLRKAEQDRKNAAAQAKADKLEAKTQAKAIQDARLKTERKAKEQAKELARLQKLTADAAHQAEAEAAKKLTQIALARTKAQESAAQKQQIETALLQKQQAKAEQIAELQTQQKTQQTAENMRARLAADEKANLDAKDNVRLEMERIGREADIARQAAMVQQRVADIKQNAEKQVISHKPKQVLIKLAPGAESKINSVDAAEAAEEAAYQAADEAEKIEENQQEQATKTNKQIQSSINQTAKKVEKTAQQVVEDSGRAEIKNAAKIEADTNDGMRDGAQSFISAKIIKRWLAWVAKVGFIYLPVSALILLVLLHFVNLSALIKPIEHLASNSIGEPIVIQKVHASIWPQPHLVLQNVTIGENKPINNIHVLFVSTSLFNQVKQVKTLVVEGLTIEQADFSQFIQRVNNINSSKNLKVAQIQVKNFTLAFRDLSLGTFDGKVTLSDAGKLSAVHLVSRNNALSVTIMPKGSDYEIALKAANWILPFNQKILFNRLSANGLVTHNNISFNQIEGEIYGGSVIAQATVAWPNNGNFWLTNGNFALSNANAEQLLNAQGSAVTIDGKLMMNGNFSSKARDAINLASSTIMAANFNVRQGSIKGVELARAVINQGRQSLAGNNTNFDKLSGNIKINQNQYQFAKLALLSPQFNASGFININNNQTLTGKLNADLAAQSRRLQTSFAITGRGKDLKSR